MARWALALMLFVAVLSVMLHSLWSFRQSGGGHGAMPRALDAAILALSVYFLLVCGFDEMTYMFDAALLYWTLATLLFCLRRRVAA